ncbi:MAG: hypothetical protein ACTHXA_00015 [Gulosibacter sp.]|uniref:hypothetical protein n=1 Tax=Gulosibacter sp. TaxID=2817531 RepID=UPI003F935747
MKSGRLVETIFTVVAYLVFGIMAGAVGTFAHRGRLELFGTTWWLGWAVALLAVGLIAVGLRLYLDERKPGLAFAIGVCAAVMMYTTGGAGQSVVLPASPTGFGASEVWMYGAAVVSFLPVLWPRIQSQPQQPETMEDHA